MKAQFLKISGHKNEKDFYKEFPTIDSFMAKHGAKLRAQYGDQIPPYVDTSLGTVAGGANRFSLNQFGMQNTAAPNPNAGVGFTPTNFFAKQTPFDPNATSKAWAAKNPTVGNQMPEDIGYNANIGAQKSMDTGKAIQTGIGMVDKVIGGFKALKAEKQALKSAKQWNKVSEVALQASKTRDVNERTDIADTAARTRKALMPTITGEELYPVTGVGTNVLTKFGGKMMGGGEIQNTYAPQDMYKDLAYEPLGESTFGFQPMPETQIMKAYKEGGYLYPKAFWGSIMSSIGGSMGSSAAGSAAGSAGGGMFSGMGKNFMGALGGGGGGQGGSNTGAGIAAGGDAASSLAGSITGNNAGSQIGGGFGEAAGSLFGPIGDAIGKTAGTLIGGLLDKNPKRIKKNQEQMMGNIGNMSGVSTIGNFQNQYSGVFEHGGAMNEYPNPRIIKYFGEHNVNDLLRRDPMMDTLRTGGNIRSNEVGDIRIAENGRLEPISYNPYTAGSGVTSMIQGPSHDRGGVNINYNGNMVEAEGGEPISERQDGGDVGPAAVITGDQTFNKMGAHEIPELAEYAGKKVKHIQKDLAEKDAKLNKLQAKNTKALNEFEPKNQIDKLTFNSLHMNEKGVTEQYKRNALKTQSLIAYQDAINQEAESRGLDAGALSRGQVKPLPPEEMMRAKEQTAQFGRITPAAPASDMFGSQAASQAMADYIARHTKKPAAKKAPVVKTPTPYLPAPKAPWEVDVEKYQESQAQAKREMDARMAAPATPANKVTKAAAANTLAASKAKAAVTTPSVNSPGLAPALKAQAAKEEKLIPNTLDLPPIDPAEYDKLQTMYEAAKGQKKGKLVSDFQEYYHKVAPDYARAVLKSAPLTAKGKKEGLTTADLPSNVDEYFGPRTEQYMAALKKGEAKKPGETPVVPTPGTPEEKDKSGVYETAPYQKYGWEQLAGQLMPWLRKTPGEPLLGDQLAGEMYAMSNNQVEPVQARFMHPQLDVPYDISFQDRLNENQASFNALTRQAGANPEALAALAGQKYGADSSVLAEQFRANQAKKDQVYSQNRQTLNQAQQTNLGIADQQYVRQAQAKSNTKVAMQEALNSIASKIGQNRLENRTLQTYANMFPDFSYDRNYSIRKTGAPTTFNMPVVYNAAGDITHVALYDKEGKIYDYRPISAEEQKTMGKKTTEKPSLATESIVKKERNGGLVKAFRNL